MTVADGVAPCERFVPLSCRFGEARWLSRSYRSVMKGLTVPRGRARGFPICGRWCTMGQCVSYLRSLPPEACTTVGGWSSPVPRLF